MEEEARGKQQRRGAARRAKADGSGLRAARTGACGLLGATRSWRAPLPDLSIESGDLSPERQALQTGLHLLNHQAVIKRSLQAHPWPHSAIKGPRRHLSVGSLSASEIKAVDAGRQALQARLRWSLLGPHACTGRDACRCSGTTCMASCARFLMAAAPAALLTPRRRMWPGASASASDWAHSEPWCLPLVRLGCNARSRSARGRYRAACDIAKARLAVCSLVNRPAGRNVRGGVAR